MESIGVRELRQNASKYLERVAGGESLEVTDRGRPVARLVPIVADQWSTLLAAGRVISADDDGDIAAEAPVDYQIDATRELAAMREGER